MARALPRLRSGDMHSAPGRCVRVPRRGLLALFELVLVTDSIDVSLPAIIPSIGVYLSILHPVRGELCRPRNEDSDLRESQRAADSTAAYTPHGPPFGADRWAKRKRREPR